jgi:predicted lipid-binding transport protein (Tim44 family)
LYFIILQLSVSALLDIVFLVILTVFLVFKLRSILGRENELDLVGKTKSAKSKSSTATIVDITPNEDEQKAKAFVSRYIPQNKDFISEEALQGFSIIQKKLPEITPEKFVSLAAEVLFLILESYDEGTLEPIMPLVSSEIYSNLNTALNMDKAGNIRQRISIIKVQEAKIIGSTISNDTMRVKVSFKTKQSQYTQSINSADPSKEDAQQELVVDAHDIWEFVKNQNDQSTVWIVSSIVPA